MSLKQCVRTTLKDLDKQGFQSTYRAGTPQFTTSSAVRGVFLDSGDIPGGRSRKEHGPLMRALSSRRLLKLTVPLICLTVLRPGPRAVSNFTFYADVASAATTNCTPTSSGCTGTCVAPSCGTQAIPCHKIQEAVNLANCTIGTNTTLEADVIVAGGTVPAPKVYNEKVYIYPNI